jgi:hypothetical protein
MDAEGPQDSAPAEDGGGVDVAAVAGELYGLLPGEFTAARDSAVKRAKADGDKPAAAAIAALRRPSLAAWVVNALVRHRRDEVEQLLTLGEALRTAQQGLAGRRVTSPRPATAAGALRRQPQARALARELGQPVSEDVGLEVEQTLGAAMADPAVAEAVRSGRLVSPTSYAGLGLDTAAPPAPKPRLAVVKQGKTKTADGDEQARRRDEEARRREAERRRPRSSRPAATPTRRSTPGATPTRPPRGAAAHTTRPRRPSSPARAPRGAAGPAAAGRARPGRRDPGPSVPCAGTSRTPPGSPTSPAAAATGPATG